jgi:hypothetical protein
MNSSKDFSTRGRQHIDAIVAALNLICPDSLPITGKP